ncbi:Uma2 family endonuclease [Prosthecobacter sp.]|uniref:Uma2 family endonuclease n=1 Tax=Prosthecobacter sp. TaxID=1965333 RepID=UPI003784C3A6
MVPILSQPDFQQRALPLSVAGWHQMIDNGLAPERAELIRGVIIEKMSKPFLHTKLADVLIEFLRATVNGSFWIRQEAPLTLRDSEPEPDISIVDGRRDDYQSHPVTARLVVEVSVSSLLVEREMASVYAEAGVAEYWIVNATERCIEVYRDPVNGHYQRHQRVPEGEVLQCAALNTVSVNVAELFASA